MRALVTGGAGFIGSNLAQELVRQGGDVTVIDNFVSGHFENIRDFQCDVMPMDISVLEWERLPKFDVIFHQQAITDTTVMDQRWMLNQNTESFRSLLSYVLKQRIPLIYASSAGVYGNAEPPQTEDQGLVPLNVYGYSKLLMDRLAQRALSEARSPLVGLRYFNVFGQRERFKGSAASMIYQLAEQMRAGRAPRIFEFGEQARDHVYVKDVVAANLCAWNSEKKGIYNVGTGKMTTFNRLIEILNNVLGKSFKPDYFKNPYSFYQNHTQAHTSNAEKEIGFKSRWSVEEGIADYLTPSHQRQERSSSRTSA